MLEYRNGELWCPNCECKADLEVSKGKLKVSFSRESINHNRWGEWGGKVHMENIARGHGMALAGKDAIAEKRKLFDKKPIKLPEIKGIPC